MESCCLLLSLPEVSLPIMGQMYNALSDIVTVYECIHMFCNISTKIAFIFVRNLQD